MTRRGKVATGALLVLAALVVWLTRNPDCDAACREAGFAYAATTQGCAVYCRCLGHGE